MPYQPELERFNSAFDGITFAPGSDISGFRVIDTGLLHLASGQLCASDPLVCPDPPAFTQQVPIGDWPVQVAVACLANGDERMAYARVVFANAPVSRWVMASTPDQPDGEMGEDEFYGYGVDAGTGCFMDLRASVLLAACMQADSDYFEQMIDAMQANYRDTHCWVDLRPDPQRPDNVMCFSSGWGDGCYPSFFGHAADGTLVCVMTDFLV
ncbi:Protein of unknown function [Andreprevotia lacus DSM 23236]|jgi:hypothetical protein|uniref:DUF4241 domain-containing protein n=1 Tax=Andreprevotia lacus DSM 23236 TaxID=1121001 RepID=A0A1W1Y030_9NEIS|nr:DUF4241 domain-containing protein [Andreprevotia lacus]SMC29492.1 Protein of unknown function [Andreprevotia lacus DSM 23236]